MLVIQDRPGTVDVDEFLARPLFAHLATSSDSGPRESPVWFLWDDSAIWILGSLETDSFPARIEREPRCAIGIIDFDRSRGLVQHVGLRGTATIKAFDRGRARRLLARYLGDRDDRWDERFRQTLADPERTRTVLIRFEAESAVARDVSYTVADAS